MFVRIKRKGPYRYLQIVENHREGKRVVQRVIGSLGRLEQVSSSGEIDGLVRSLARYAREVRLVEGHRAGELEAGASRSVGPDLVFGRLWEELGIGPSLEEMLQKRSYEFSVERAVYLTVLHRLFESSSDRAAERWKRDVVIPGIEGLKLHHLYRAMRWLGAVQETLEERLFAARRDLFTQVTLAFFDTTSLYFEGSGGESLGRYGHSKDRRPDRRQLVLGAVLTQEGRPVASEMWQGNKADVSTLLPVVDRLRERFGLRQVCWVADRGMISASTIDELEGRELEYIFGARMRRQKEVREEVLSRAGRYREVEANLRVKEVFVEGRRYIVCHNREEEAKDALDREAMLRSLEDRLREGTGGLIGNRGFRRFLKVEKGAVRIDPEKVAAEARYDGKFVLRTNATIPAQEVAVQYKQLLLVERFFRAIKSVLETRPIYHKWDATIRGHVFCSFLALLLVDELQRRLGALGHKVEWEQAKQDLEALQETEVRLGQQWYLLRGPLQGVAGKVLQAAGVAPPPAVRPLA